MKGYNVVFEGDIQDTRIYSGKFTNLDTGVSYQIKGIKSFPNINGVEDQEIFISFRGEQEKSKIVIKDKKIVGFEGSKYLPISQNMPIIHVNRVIQIKNEIYLESPKVVKDDYYADGLFKFGYYGELNLVDGVEVVKNGEVSIYKEIMDGNILARSLRYGDDVKSQGSLITIHQVHHYMLGMDSSNNFFGWMNRQNSNYAEGQIDCSFEVLCGMVSYYKEDSKINRERYIIFGKELDNFDNPSFQTLKIRNRMSGNSKNRSLILLNAENQVVRIKADKLTEFLNR